MPLIASRIANAAVLCLMLVVLVGVAKAQTLTVSPASDTATAPAKPTLTWDFTGGTNCTATGNWSGAKAATGTLTLGDFPAGTHTFTLACTFPGVLTDTKATLAWVAPTANTDGSALTNLASYRVKYGTSATALTQVQTVTAPATGAAVNNLTVGTWYFGVTALNSAGAESALSNVASKTIAQPPAQIISRTVTWIVKPAPIPQPPSGLTVTDAVVAGLNMTPVFKLTSTGKRSAEAAGFVAVGTECSGNVLFYYREKPFRRVSAEKVAWWGVVPSSNVAAQCKQPSA